MLEDQRPGTVYWIDHYAVGTNDLQRWVDFHERVLGGQTTRTNRPDPKNMFQQLGQCLHGGFLQPVQLPGSAGPGKALPRYGFWIRPEDIELQLRHLDEQQVPHADPSRATCGVLRTSSTATARSHHSPAPTSRPTRWCCRSLAGGA